MKTHEQKITEAAQRNRKYKAMTHGEKIASALSRRGTSTKELTKLEKAIPVCLECGLGYDCVCATEPDEVRLEK